MKFLTIRLGGRKFSENLSEEAFIIRILFELFIFLILFNILSDNIIRYLDLVNYDGNNSYPIRIAMNGSLFYYCARVLELILFLCADDFIEVISYPIYSEIFSTTCGIFYLVVANVLSACSKVKTSEDSIFFEG